MTRRILAVLLVTTGAAAGTPPPVAKVIDTYCARCHDGRVAPSENVVKELDGAHIADNAALWSRAERHLRAGTMPPVGSKRPNRSESDKAILAIESELDVLAPAADTSQNIATRLAGLLWNAAPDAALQQAAQRDQLRDAKVLEGEVHRMLADPRSEHFVSTFFASWLQLEKLDKADPDKRFYPDYEPSLRDAMRRETELFILSQLQEDRDPAELWTASYSVINEQLAKHYGVPGVSGPQFRKVSLMPERAGLLGQSSIMMITSRHQHGVDAAYTSPASRALFVLGNFLGVSPPGAFPGAQPVKPEIPITGQARLLKANPCTNCHRNFFPLGYALENFDGIGRWRTQDQVAPIDASGAMVDGKPFNGPVELRNALLQKSDAFRTTITERLLAHIAGSRFNELKGSPRTLAAARRILRDNKQVHWSTVIAGAVRTQPVTPD